MDNLYTVVVKFPNVDKAYELDTVTCLEQGSCSLPRVVIRVFNPGIVTTQEAKRAGFKAIHNMRNYIKGGL